MPETTDDGAENRLSDKGSSARKLSDCCAAVTDMADLCEACSLAVVDQLMADPAFVATLRCWEDRNAG